MKSLFSYSCLVLGTFLGTFLGVNETTSAPTSRTIAVYASKSLDFVKAPLAVRAGSIDLLEDQSMGVRLVGWVAPVVDEIILVPKKVGPHFVARFNLTARNDVFGSFGTLDYLWSGVDLSVPNLSLSSLSCVVYSNSTGATVMWSSGTQCMSKTKSREFNFSDVEDVP
jgi:hypothetical protein